MMGKSKLIIVCTKLDKEVKHLINISRRDVRRDGRFYLLQQEVSFQDPKPFSVQTLSAAYSVNEEQNAVNHHKYTLNLTAEVGMTGSVYDIYFSSVIHNRRIF